MIDFLKTVWKGLKGLVLFLALMIALVAVLALVGVVGLAIIILVNAGLSAFFGTWGAFVFWGIVAFILLCHHIGTQI